MTPEDIKELRELIRADMVENDYYIDQDRVERFFRKLLGEPEPVVEAYVRDPNSKPIDSAIVAAELDRLVPTLQKAFESNDAFYSSIMKKR